MGTFYELPDISPIILSFVFIEIDVYSESVDILQFLNIIIIIIDNYFL